MCGIVGYIGKNNALPILINSLKNLEYRGYDSAGIAYFDKSNKLKIIKEKGKICELEKKIDYSIDTSIGIGHTRWATHGIPNTTNSHPHNVGKITIVHNGIIENYKELKNKLIKNNYTFKSQTDTEVACALIDFLYKDKKDLLLALNECKNILVGSYAISILCSDYPNTIYLIKKNSPLIVGVKSKEYFIASDVPAILEYTNKYIILEDNDIAIVKKDSIKVYHDSKEIKKDILTFDYNIDSVSKNNYEHFMLKEIHEQSKLIKNNIAFYLDKDFKNIKDLSNYKNIEIVACGSAYHAGLVGKYFFEQYADIKTDVYIASEYRYQKLFLKKDTLVIFISQSGETADTLASLKIVKEKNIDTLGIINALGSSIARLVDDVIYTNAGPEIAVASTKAYTAQILILSFLALKTGIKKSIIAKEEINHIINNYNDIPKNIDNLLKIDYQKIAKKIYNRKDVFFIGRQSNYYTALEGSLKLKEISYINSNAYPSGELKHGTISLITINTPVIIINTINHIYDKTISNVKEVKARGAYNILLTNRQEDDTSIDYIITVPKTHELCEPITNVIPLQMISYEVAKLKKCDIDKPRNLAKSVTVE